MKDFEKIFCKIRKKFYYGVPVTLKKSELQIIVTHFSQCSISTLSENARRPKDFRASRNGTLGLNGLIFSGKPSIRKDAATGGVL